MFENFSGRVTDALVHNQIINIEDRDIYCYGVQQGLVAVLNFATTLLIGCLYGMPWESIIYMICYIPLRHYAGGFHAKTPARCYVFSIFMLFSVLLALKYIILSRRICCILVLFALLYIFVCAPVADYNKPLDDTEYHVYHKYATIVAVIEVGITLICLVSSLLYLAKCIAYCLIITVIMMTLGIGKNILMRKQHCSFTKE